MTVSASCAITVTAKNGKVVYWSGIGGSNSFVPIATDTNGNQITTNTSEQIFDTLSSTTPVLTESGTAPSNTTFTYTPPGGGSAAYTMKYTSYTVKTNFGCSGIAEYSVAQDLVTEIDLADQGTNPSDRYVFTYESTPGYSGDVTGRLASVTLPTGGTIYYTYSGGNNGIVCSDGSTATLQRQTPDGTWTYAHSESGTAWTTTQTDPQSNVTTMNFQGIYVTQTSNALETTYTCYNGAAIPCVSTAITLPITQVTGQLKWPTALESQTITKYNATTGVVTEKDEYDYGQGAPGGLIRQTLTSYASLGNGIVSAPASVTVKDGSGATRAQTNYTYDGAALASSGISTQHVSVTGSRGNATTVSQWVGGSTYVNQNFTYLDTGMVQTATDPKGNVTNYTYASTYVGAYLTKVTNALSQATNFGYDPYTGLLISVTDPNGQGTTYGFDHMLRNTQINYPDGGQTNLVYVLGSFGGNYVQTTEKMDTSGHDRVSYIWADGLGRRARVAVTSGESLVYNETLNTCFNLMRSIG